MDVGRGLLDYRLRQDERVVPIENANARYLESLGEPVELAVIDVSFISLRLILPAVGRLAAPSAEVVALVKPQFEAGKAEVGKGGIVRDPRIHRRVLKDFVEAAESQGYGVLDLMRSPITGAKGNVEFLAWLRIGRARASRGSIADKIDALTAADR